MVLMTQVFIWYIEVSILHQCTPVGSLCHDTIFFIVSLVATSLYDAFLPGAMPGKGEVLPYFILFSILCFFKDRIDKKHSPAIAAKS